MMGIQVARKEPDITIEHVSPDTLKPYMGNPRKNEAAIGPVRRSIEHFGFINPIIALRNSNMIVAGHTRWKAALKDDLKTVPVVFVNLSEEDARLYNLADNKLGEIAEWDIPGLDAVLEELKALDVDISLAGFGDYDFGPTEGLNDPDDVPDVPEEPVTKTGDLWILGNHRLLCGDSTVAADVDRVMDGEKVGLCFTSPPYLQQRDYTRKINNWDILMCRVFGNIPMEEDGQVLVNLGLIHKDGEWIPYWQEWVEWMRKQGWRRFGWYVWDKLEGIPGDFGGRFRPAHEWIFHFAKQRKNPQKTSTCKHAGEIQNPTGMREKDNIVNSHWTQRGEPIAEFKVIDSVIRVAPAKGGYGGHPAPFSIGLVMEILKAFPLNIYDPFVGSGTTIIAAEMMGKSCYAMEIEPTYCDVTVRRWQDFTGRQAVREGDGVLFDDLILKEQVA